MMAPISWTRTLSRVSWIVLPAASERLEKNIANNWCEATRGAHRILKIKSCTGRWGP